MDRRQVDAKLREYSSARELRNFALSDAIRQDLMSHGVGVKDTKIGTLATEGSEAEIIKLQNKISALQSKLDTANFEINVLRNRERDHARKQATHIICK